MILPCIAFQVGFLCPNGSLDDSSLSAPLQPPPWWTYPFAFIIPIFYMVCKFLLLTTPLSQPQYP